MPHSLVQRLPSQTYDSNLITYILIKFNEDSNRKRRLLQMAHQMSWLSFN